MYGRAGTGDDVDQRIVITGLGAVSPIGVGLAAFRDGLRAGRSGVRLLDAGRPLATTVAGCCDAFAPESVMAAADLKRLPRCVPMGLAAAREAAEQACLRGWLDAESQTPGPASVERSRRVGLILGTGGGGIDFTLDQASAVHGGRPPSLWTITNATHGNLAGELSIRMGLRGPSMCVSDGCASSSDAVGVALDMLRGTRRGGPDALVVVGADAHIRWETLRGMELLKVISTRDWRARPALAHTACRPFDQSRDGFVLGEGAWAVVLERASFARARGAATLGEVAGYGATCDAYHRVRPEPSMGECAHAMRLAVADAGMRPEDVGIVHYHGTGTVVNDVQETAAVRQAFGRHAERLQGSSVKGAIGHPQGACGLAALVATLAGLNDREPFVPPTLNLHRAGAGCDLDYTPLDAAPARSGTALINCLAFGAKNSALVVRRA